MQTRFLKVAVSVFLIALVMMTLGLFAKPAEASSVQDDATSIDSDDDGVVLAASRPWTAAEMKAAKPYPMAQEANGADYTVSNVGADGPAGSVRGSRSGAQSNKADAESLAVEEIGAIPLGYTYPAPFTRFPVDSIASSANYPFRAIGKLFFTQNNVNYVCSASVTGLYGIMTAGHCVHAGNNKKTGWSTNVVFVPAYIDGQAPYGQWTCKTLRTFTVWYKSSDLARDWGVCKTNTNDGVNIGSMVGYLGYTWNYARNQDWWLLGYPAAAPFNGARMQACTAGYAYNSPFGTTPDPMGVGCDQTGGTSGGPWIRSFGTGYYVGGVNSHRTSTKPKELFSPYADTTVKTSYFDYTRAP